MSDETKFSEWVGSNKTVLEAFAEGTMRGMSGAERLEILKVWRQKGVITDEEFERLVKE